MHRLHAMVFTLLLAVHAYSPAMAAEFSEDLTSSGAATTTNTISTSPSSDGFFSRLASNMSYGFFNFASAPMVQANETAARIESYSYLTADYTIARRRKLSIRPVFQWGTAGTNYRNDYVAGDFKLGDAFVNYSHRGIEMPADFDFSYQVRVYAPTSEESASKATIARLRPQVEIQRRLTRNWNARFTFEPDYYFQSRTGSANKFTGRPEGHRNYGYESEVELSYQIMRGLSVMGLVGHDEMWHHEMPESGVSLFRREDMRLESGFMISAGPLFMVVGIGQKRDVSGRQKAEFEFFNDDETQYNLLTSYRF